MERPASPLGRKNSEVGTHIDMSELAVADTEMSRREDGGALVETPAGSMPAASDDDEETDLEGGSAHNYDRIPSDIFTTFPFEPAATVNSSDAF
jgi:hypothetical protein